MEEALKIKTIILEAKGIKIEFRKDYFLESNINQDPKSHSDFDVWLYKGDKKHYIGIQKTQCEENLILKGLDLFLNLVA